MRMTDPITIIHDRYTYVHFIFIGVFLGIQERLRLSNACFLEHKQNSLTIRHKEHIQRQDSEN